MTEKAGYVAPRTCTVVDEFDLRPERGKQTPLTEYADRGAYVLIAEPGAGKTTAFKSEAAKPGAMYVSVRKFRTLDEPEWRDKTLFLDGLDELRAGAVDGRTPLERNSDEAVPPRMSAVPFVLPVGRLARGERQGTASGSLAGRHSHGGPAGSVVGAQH